MPIPGPGAGVLRFNDYELDTHAGELRKRGVKLRLQGQPLQVLAVLLDRAGDLVTREELRAQIWTPDTFVDFDHSLHNAIARLRDVLGDSAETPRFIETLPRRGYRFIGDVARANGTKMQAGPPSAPSEQGAIPLQVMPEATRTRGIKSVRLRWLVLAGLVLIATFANAYLVLRSRLEKAASTKISSLALLPLKNLSGDPAQEYLADGMTEELIGQLSGIHDLRVISRTSVVRFKDTQLSVPEIARTLNADAIVEGSVMRDGNRIRVHAQLIRGPSDEHLWAGSYDRQLQNVLPLESEVTQAIADQIRVALTPQEQARLHSARTVDTEAYEAYLKGRFFLEVNPTLQTNKSAESYFQEAIQKDSTFASAYAGLADCYLDSGAYRWRRPEDAYRLSTEAIQNAIRLEPTLSEAHASLGYLHWRYGWDSTAAEREIRYALDLNPNNIDGRERFIWFLSWSGRKAEALAELDKIRTSDPAYPLVALDESGVYYHVRDYKSLMETSGKAVTSDPDNWSSHYFLAVSHDGSGQPAAAIPEYEKAVDLSQGNTDALAGLAHAYACVGEKREASKILRQLQEQSKGSYVSPYMLATIHASLGNKDMAFALLEKAYQERSPDIAYFLKADLRLDQLRDDPRFQDLLRRVGMN